MKLKIKSLEVTLREPTFHPELNPIEHCALCTTWANSIKKVWTPIISAMETTNTIDENLPNIIQKWSLSFQLGDRSKKVNTLALKILKGKIEEKLEELRYNKKEAKDSGLIERTIESYVLEKNYMWSKSVLKAKNTIPPSDQLDPLPLTQDELDTLTESTQK